MPAHAVQLQDVREGGRWTPWQRIKNACIRALVITALAVADVLPETVLRALLGFAGRVAYRLDRSGRARAEARIRDALPERDARAMARESYLVAGKSLADCLALRRRHVRARERVQIDRETLRLLTSENGVIAVSAHLGPFELIAAAVAEHGLAPAVVVRESYDPKLDPIVDRHRNDRGVEVIHRGRASASFAIVRALKRGRPVGILPDLGGRVACTRVRFLGREQPFPLGPARLALRTQATLASVTLEPRASGDYALVASVIDAEGDETALTQRIAEALEFAILSNPDAWLWMAGPSAYSSLGLEKKRAVR